MVGLDNSAERCFGVTPDWYKSGNSDAIKKSVGIAHDGQEQATLRLGKPSRRVVVMLCRSKKHWNLDYPCIYP